MTNCGKSFTLGNFLSFYRAVRMFASLSSRFVRRSVNIIQQQNWNRWYSVQLPIIWTKCDEAPALASYALLPVVSKFAKVSG